MRTSKAFLILCMLFLSWLQLGLSGTPAFAQAPAAVAAAKTETPSPDIDALVRVLKDDASRAKLIERLQSGDTAAKLEAPPTQTMTRKIAAQGRAAAMEISAFARDLARSSDETFARLRMMDQATWMDIAEGGAGLLVLAGTLFITLWTTRAAMAWFSLRGAPRRTRNLAAHRVLSAFRKLVAETASLALAWLAGNAVIVALPPGGYGGTAQALFLNAFLVAEAMLIALRFALAPYRPDARVAPMADSSAIYWSIWLSRLVVVLVYAFLFAAPLAEQALSNEIADSVVILAMFTATLIGIIVIMQNRLAVREALTARMAESGDGVAGFYAFIGRIWHALAVACLVTFFLVWLARPDVALSFILTSAVKTLIIVAIGRIVIGVMSRALGHGVRLPAEVRARLPLLEARLNAFVPAAMRVVRLIVLIIILLAIARAWSLVDVFGWATTGAGMLVIASALSTLLILLAGGVIYIAVLSWIEYRLNPAFGTTPSQRERTLLALFQSAFTVALAVIVVMMALSELGVNIGPLLAGAGVVGLAVGFGAQKLVQDVITGVFIQIENVMNEGDVVSVGGVAGVVERLTIRSVGIRDLSGAYHSIPFSAVDKVTNMMRQFSFYLADVGVAYRENVADVKAAMQAAFDLLMESPEHKANVIGPFEMMGLDRFADSAVIVRGRIKTLPGQQWQTGRAYNECLKTVFDARGIEMPFPHVTLYAGEDKAGKAPPFRILREDAAPPTDEKPATTSMSRTAIDSTSAAHE